MLLFSQGQGTVRPDKTALAVSHGPPPLAGVSEPARGEDCSRCISWFSSLSWGQSARGKGTGLLSPHLMVALMNFSETGDRGQCALTRLLSPHLMVLLA